MTTTPRNSAANTIVRLAQVDDCEGVARMCHQLWPDASAQQHLEELLPKVEGRSTRLLPVVVLVAEAPPGDNSGAVTPANRSELIGFVEVGLRSHADGCDESHAVGYIEGWFVAESWRKQGVGRKLVAAAENWARAQGCREMASDAGSITKHLSLRTRLWALKSWIAA